MVFPANSLGFPDATTTKSTPVGADLFFMADSASNNAIKKGTLSTIPQMPWVVNAQTTGYTAVAADQGKVIRYTGGGGVTLALTASATLGNGWFTTLRNDSSGTITINPDASETINGATTLAVTAGNSVMIFTNGTLFYTVGIPFTPYSPGGTDVPVADGGTGVSSLTAYAVICGGTTSTNPVQSIASVGTSGQVLTSNGAGALPTFQTVGASSGNWVLLATVAASASANVDFTTNINTTYDEYVVLSDQIVFATSGVNMQLRVSIAATFQTGANYNYAYGYIANNGTNATGSASGTFAIMNGFTLTNSANYTNGFELSLKAPGSTSYKNIQWWFTGPYSADNRVTMNYGGLIFSGSTSAIDGLRFYSSSGNITSGNFYLYGIKKT